MKSKVSINIECTLLDDNQDELNASIEYVKSELLTVLAEMDVEVIDVKHEIDSAEE